MSSVRKGEWVQISTIVLPAGQRAPQVPQDTQNCDLMLWVKGVAQSDGQIGKPIEILTVTGRREQGVLQDVRPAYAHTYGNFVPELLQIQLQLKGLLSEEDD